MADLDDCRARWRGTIPLADIHLREALRRQCDADTVSMLVGEILRLREHFCAVHQPEVGDECSRCTAAREVERLREEVERLRIAEGEALLVVETVETQRGHARDEIARVQRMSTDMMDALRAEIARLTAMVQAGHTHEWFSIGRIASSWRKYTLAVRCRSCALLTEWEADDD